VSVKQKKGEGEDEVRHAEMPKQVIGPSANTPTRKNPNPTLTCTHVPMTITNFEDKI